MKKIQFDALPAPTPEKLHGLQKICRIYGGMTAKGADGKTVEYRWDYFNERAYVKGELNKEQEGRSEKAKYAKFTNQIP